LKAPHPARSAKLSNVGLTSVPESETVWEHAVSSAIMVIAWRQRGGVLFSASLMLSNISFLRYVLCWVLPFANSSRNDHYCGKFLRLIRSNYSHKNQCVWSSLGPHGCRKRRAPGQSGQTGGDDDPRHSRIDGNAVGMLQISVYRQRFVRSCQSAENEPKDAEQTEEELHPVENREDVNRRGSKSDTSQGREEHLTTESHARVYTVLQSTVGRWISEAPTKSPSASSKPPGFRSFHIRLVRGAGGQLAVPLRRLLIQGRRLTFRRRVSSDPEPGSPDAAIAIYSTLRAHCS
ncbi:hypothetical protein T12_151, partial [Trichinella patagoniensis]